MAGTSNVSFTMQELGNPVSVAGQGEQATCVVNLRFKNTEDLLQM